MVSTNRPRDFELIFWNSPVTCRYENMREFWRRHCASSATTPPHTWRNLAQFSLPKSHVFRPSARIFAFVFARGACACGANSAEKVCKLRRKHCMSSLATALHTRSNLAQIPRRNRTSFVVHASGTRAFLHLFCARCARVGRKLCRKDAQNSAQMLASSAVTMLHMRRNFAQFSWPESHAFRPVARIFAFLFARGTCAGARSAQNLQKR